MTQSKPKSQLEKPVCSVCRSDDVVKDAWAVWDNKAQSWELETTYDEAFCKHGEVSCELDWVDADTPIPDPTLPNPHNN